MAAFTRTVVTSLGFILVTTVGAIVYGFISQKTFTLAYIFRANFLVGTFLLVVALIKFMLPASFRFNKLTGINLDKETTKKYDKLNDHTTFAERYYAEKHMDKQEKAYEFLILGLLVIIIPGTFWIKAKAKYRITCIISEKIRILRTPNLNSSRL